MEPLNNYNATRLTPHAPTCIMTCASDFAVEAVLQEKIRTQRKRDTVYSIESLLLSTLLKSIFAILSKDVSFFT